MSEKAMSGTAELCTWTLDAERDLWRLGIVVAEEDIPADRRPGKGQSLFADLNGIAGRTDVARGIMTRHDGPSGGEFAIDLDVPRGFRGGLHFMAVPAGLQTADRPTWLAALEGSFVPIRHTELSVVRNTRGIAALAVAAPDAVPLRWPPPDGPPLSGIGSDDVTERIVTLDSSPRRVWIHRPNRAAASAPVLVVFDGRGFVDGGLLAAIDEFDSPPSAVIAIDHERAAAEVSDGGPGASENPDGESRVHEPTAGDPGAGSVRAPDPGVRIRRPSDPSMGNLRADDLVMNLDFCDDVLDLVASIAPDHGVRALVAGASYGGLAAAYFALRHPQRFRGICLSPSFWQTDAAGRRIWDHVPDTVPGPDAAARPDLVIDFGVLEPVIADSVAEAVTEFADRGLEVEARSFVGGHEYLWWRDLLLGRLGEALGAGAPAPLAGGHRAPLAGGHPAPLAGGAPAPHAGGAPGAQSE